MAEAHEVRRQQQRIPLLARVEAACDRPLGTMYAVNISGGGVYLKAPSAAANDVPTGTALALSFDLDSRLVEVAGEVVWVDPGLRDHEGESAVGFGVRFGTLSGDARSALARFIDSFRYRVAMIDFADIGLAENAFGDLFGLEPTSAEAGLAAALARRQTGLILLGDASGNEALVRTLQLLLTTHFAEEPPILVAAHTVTPELETLVSSHARVSLVTSALTTIELRSLVRHSVESYALNFQNELLTIELQRALERMKRENRYLRERIGGPQPLAGMIGNSAAMHEVYRLVEQVAGFTTGVLITGETGTGKELVARAIHDRSPRVDRPFIAQNCAALADTLLDSELFGHARGAFTGANADRVGLFEAADGGTIFLDEVGEMPLGMQAKLLRVLQDGEVRRVGDTRSRHVNVRVLCATHRDLSAMVKAGTFREDLFYRLRTFVIDLPPLRARREDVAALVMHFLHGVAERHAVDNKEISEEALQVLAALEWPGNVRELAHAVERLFVHATHGLIDGHLVRRTLGVEATQEGSADNLPHAVAEFEKTRIREALRASNGNITHASSLLGVNRSTLSKQCKRLGIRISDI